jgi:3-phenylpropionate/cinnamic acid dioxygenase small subunit
MEIPKEKRPPDLMIWDGTADELEDWIDRVFSNKSSNSRPDTIEFFISDKEIEG